MKILKIIVLSLILLAFAVTASFAKDITLSWDASPSEVVEGYRLFYSQSSVLAQCVTPSICETIGGVYYVDAGNVLEYTLQDVGVGNWFIVATAWNNIKESAFSNEVSTTIMAWNPGPNKPHPPKPSPRPPGQIRK